MLRKKNSILYLSIYYLHIGLDYMTIFTQHFFFLSKIFLYFFLRWNCSLGLLIYFYIFIYLFISILLIKEILKSLHIKLQPTLLLRINHLFLLCNFKTLLKNLNLIVHLIFGLITSHLIHFTYWEGVWLWCEFYFSFYLLF